MEFCSSLLEIAVLLSFVLAIEATTQWNKYLSPCRGGIGSNVTVEHVMVAFPRSGLLGCVVGGISSTKMIPLRFPVASVISSIGSYDCFSVLMWLSVPSLDLYPVLDVDGLCFGSSSVPSLICVC